MVGRRDPHVEGWIYSGWIYQIQLAAARAHDPALVAEGRPDPVDGDGRERQTQAHRELAGLERPALEASLDPGWIADARAVGAFIGSSGHRIPMGARPLRTLGAEVFYVDILMADLWHLERMAALEVARQDLIETGAWGHGLESDAAAGLYEHMRVRYSRAFQTVGGAQITEQEGELLWGSSAQAIRGAHAASVAAMSPTEVHDHWQMHAFAEARLRIPGYLREDPETGEVLWQHLTEPPAPATFIAHATHARAIHLSGSAASPSPLLPGIGVDPATAADPMVGTAVDAALPGNTGTSWEPDHDGQPPPPPLERSAGTDLDAGWS